MAYITHMTHDVVAIKVNDAHELDSCFCRNIEIRTKDGCVITLNLFGKTPEELAIDFMKGRI